MIKTERMILRPVEPGDAAQLFACRSDREANKYQGWIPDLVAEVEEFIARNPAEFDVPGTWFQLALTAKDSGDLIGDAGIHFIDARQCEIGITLDAGHQGKGFALEAAHAIIGFLFADLGKHRIIASLDPRNTASLKLVERLGFRQEAHFRESLFFKGEWVDDAVYAILKREWPG
ncbi:MAG: GNAT family N-acetyltransferase [Bacteroidota bacterium]